MHRRCILQGLCLKAGRCGKAPGMANLATFLRDVMARNMTNFRLFGPDETESNKLSAVYAAGKKA